MHTCGIGRRGVSDYLIGRQWTSVQIVMLLYDQYGVARVRGACGVYCRRPPWLKGDGIVLASSSAVYMDPWDVTPSYSEGDGDGDWQDDGDSPSLCAGPKGETFRLPASLWLGVAESSARRMR